MLLFLLFVTVVVPAAWLLSEMQRHRWVSVLLGLCSIAIVAGVAYAWGAIETGFQANLSYGDASKRLARELQVQLQSGNREKVISCLDRFIESYHPTYENYPRYSDEVDKLINSMRSQEES